MNYEYSQTDLSRGVLSGLFAGLIAAVVNTVFALVYRGITSFYEFNGVDVTVIVFGSMVQLITCGLLFSFFVHNRKVGVGFYRGIVVIVTVLIVFLGIIQNRFYCPAHL